MKLLILSMLLVTTMAAPAAQSLTFHDDGSYRFYYETGKEGGSHSRSEVRNPDGVVTGKFSYEDPDGVIREVNYRADEGGFVAQGDVGVKGAPKGQFPVVQEDQPTLESGSSSPVAVDEQSAESKQEDNQQQVQTSEPLVEATHDDSYSYEEEDKDEMQDLALEESSSDDPPEAFPPGFFLQKFHGLRRLPEPTKEDKPTTTEAPKDDENQPQPQEEKDVTEVEKKDIEGPPASGNVPAEESVFSFGPVKPPFQAPAIPHQEWASAMFHQPVYVFSYRQPDSYGYHYYF